MIQGSAVANEEVYVAIVTPMGGIEVNEKRQVVCEKSKGKELVQGLYGAGGVFVLYVIQLYSICF